MAAKVLEEEQSADQIMSALPSAHEGHLGALSQCSLLPKAAHVEEQMLDKERQQVHLP